MKDSDGTIAQPPSKGSAETFCGHAGQPAKPMKFVIVIFDGLRACDVSESLTPNLFALRREGTWLARHLASFPSETRVSAAALSSGTHCGRNGIVGNHFLDQGGTQTSMVNGGNLDMLLGLGHDLPSRALTTKALGEILAESGHRMLSVGAQSSGSWGLGHWNGWSRGEFAYWSPDPLRYSDHPAIVTQAGARPPLPKVEKPAFQAATRLADVFLDTVRTNDVPTVSLIWFSEPDISQHAFGLGTPEVHEALRHADCEFGRIVDWWSQTGQSDDIQLIVGSDHGQLTIGEKVSVANSLRNAGFSVGSDFTASHEIVMSSQRVASLWFKDRDPGLSKAAFDFITEQPWCGPSFSFSNGAGEAVIPGTFSYEVMFAPHRRHPDLSVVLADLEDMQDGNPAVKTYCDGPYPVGSGMHGGLNPKELTAVGLCVGSYFQDNKVSDLPSSIVDIAPTILFGLGLSAWGGMDGRILFETMREPLAAWRPPLPEPCSRSVTGRGQSNFTVDRLRVENRIYVQGARRS